LIYLTLLLLLLFTRLFSPTTLSGLAELEQELGLNEDETNEDDYAMKVIHASRHSAAATAGTGVAFHPHPHPHSTTSSSSASSDDVPTSGFRPSVSSTLPSSPSGSASRKHGENLISGGTTDDLRGELAIVQHYKRKFNNDTVQAQGAADSTVRAIFVVKFDVNEGDHIQHCVFG